MERQTNTKSLTMQALDSISLHKSFYMYNWFSGKATVLFGVITWYLLTPKILPFRYRIAIIYNINDSIDFDVAQPKWISKHTCFMETFIYRPTLTLFKTARSYPGFRKVPVPINRHSWFFTYRELYSYRTQCKSYVDELTISFMVIPSSAYLWTEVF